MQNKVKQVGGTHYASDYDPQMLCARLNLNFHQGSIVKYLHRHADKNGKQDLEKAISLALMAGHEEPLTLSTSINSHLRDSELKRYCEANNIDIYTTHFWALALTITQKWSDVVKNIEEIIGALYPDNQ